MKTFTFEMLDRPIAFQRILVEITHSITGALLLSQAIYWQKRSETEWWYKIQQEWEEETGMGRRELETAKIACKGILECERRGVPAKCYYHVDGEALKTSLRAVQTRLAESAKLDCTKAPNKSGGISQTTIEETTSETTTPITPIGVDTLFEAFWKAYPKKTGKLAAQRAWKKIKSPATSLPEFLAALEKQKKSDQWTNENGRFIPNPATWLNQGRWMDELSPATPQSQKLRYRDADDDMPENGY